MQNSTSVNLGYQKSSFLDMLSHKEMYPLTLLRLK